MRIIFCMNHCLAITNYSKQIIMKKLSLIFAVVLSLFISLNVKAQTKTDYYPGKWDVIVIGTPNGDAKMTFVLERKDGKLAGAVQDSTGKELTTIVHKEGVCVPNAERVEDPKFLCKGDGNWTLPSGGCKCAAGYEPVGQTCQSKTFN